MIAGLHANTRIDLLASAAVKPGKNIGFSKGLDGALIAAVK